MHPACPDYYKMSPYLDLNHWAALKLRAANWQERDDAVLLNVLYVEMLRYVVRLPFKSPGALGAINDIDKAISLLEDLREALRECDTPDDAAPDMTPTQQAKMVRNLEAVVAAQPTNVVGAAVSWHDLTPAQQSYIQHYRRDNEAWGCWQMPDGDAMVVAMPGRARNTEIIQEIKAKGGTLHPIVDMPPTAAPAPPVAPDNRPLCPNRCGNRLMPTTPHDAERGDWRCMDCPTLAGSGTCNAYFWQHELDAAAALPPACANCDKPTRRIGPDKDGLWYNACPECSKDRWEVRQILAEAHAQATSCPQCHGPLVPRDQSVMLSAGDYTCMQCPSNGRGQDGHAHWWQWEVDRGKKEQEATA